MAQSDGQIIIQVSLDDKDAKKGLTGIDNEVGKLDKSTQSKFSKIGSSIKVAGLATAGVVTAIAGVGAALVGLSAPLIKAAGNAQAMNAQFDQVFGTLKETATTNLNAIATETGILPERLKGSFTQMAAFAKTTGMDTAAALSLTERATRAAADGAAFYDRSIEEVTENLQSFLKGNYENDAALGISATEFTRNAAAADLFGKKFKDLSEEQKQFTLLSMVEEGNKLSGAMGQAARESDGLENVMGNLRQAWENLKVALGEPILEPAIKAMQWLTKVINETDVTPFKQAFESIKSVVSDVIGSIRDYTDRGLSNLRSAWATNGDTIVSTAQNAYKFVVTHIQNALNAIVPFVQNQLAKIQKFWSENGKQIVEAVTIFLQGAKAVFDLVLPAILFVVEYIWTAIKNVITGSLDIIMGVTKVFSGLLTGDFSKMWEGIKQTFSGAIDLIVGLMSLSFVGSIRTLITNFTKVFINLIKTKWSTVVNLFKSSTTTVANSISSWVGKLLGFIKNLATNFTKTVTNLRTSVVSRFKELSTQAINAVKDLPTKMGQVGRDLMQGLINGVKGKAGEAVKAISGVVGNIIESAKSLLGIASPSRVMKQIGEWTGEGMANGLAATQSKVTKAMESIGQSLLNVTKKMSKEEIDATKKLADDIAKVEKNADTKIYNIKAAAKKKKRNLTTAENNKIYAIEKDEKAKIAELEAKHESAKLKSKKDADKAYLDTVTAYIDNKKSLDQMSLINEALIWEQTMELFDKGTTERIKAQQNYQKAVEAVQKELATINSTYSAQMQSVHDEMMKQEETLTKAYSDAVDKRSQSLYSFKNLFDEFKVEIDTTGQQLLINLSTQVEGFKMWQREIEALSEKAIDEGLLAELREMGPNALPQLIALNNMTSSQLTQYSDLYREKSKLAREQAEAELIGMKEDTDKQITELRDVANKQLDLLKNEWNQKIKALTKGTATELSSMKQIGIDAGQGLLDGLSKMQGPLQAKANAIASAIKTTIQQALEIRSPSRWMRDFVAGNMAKGFEVGVDKNEPQIKKAAAELGEMMKPNIVNPLRGMNINLGNLKSPPNVNTSTSTVSNDNRRNSTNQITNYFTPAQSTPSESARKQEQMLRRLAMEF